MMKKASAGLFVLVIFLLLVTCSTQALFYDFEDENQAADWTVLDGEGMIEDGRYILRNTDSSSGIAVIGDMTWTDCVITCKATMLAGSADNIGFVWRLAQNDLFYVISVRLDQRIGYCGCINGSWMNAGSPINPVPFTTEIDEEYELKLVVEGSHFQFYIDDEDMGAWEDDQLETGMIGIRVWSAVMAIDDFDVNGPNIPNTAVNSQGKMAVAWGKIKQGM